MMIYEILLSLLIIVLPFYYDLSIESKTDLSKLLFINIITSILLILWLFDILQSKKRLYIGKIGFILLVSLLSFVFSTICSIHKPISFFGCYMRYQGLMTNIVYFVLYLFILNIVKENRISLFINSCLIGGCGSAFYGILQGFGKDPLGWYDFGNRVSACFGNPVFLAAFLAMLAPLSFSLFIFAKDKRKWLYLFAFFLMFTGLLFTRTRAGIVAFFLSMVVLLFLVGRKNVFNEKVIYSLLLLFAIFLLSNFSPKTAILQRFISEFLYKPNKEVSLAEKLSATSVGGSGGLRLLMWKGGLNIIRDHPLFGIGPETLQFIWPRYAPLKYMVTTGQGSGVDRVHNEILDVAITRGLFGLICYIFLIGFLFYSGWKFKGKERIIYLGIFSASLAYLIQNQFSFAELVITPYFFIFLGMMDKIAKKEYSIPINKGLFAIISLSMVIFILFSSLKLYLADKAYYQKDLERAIKLNSYERVYYGALAGFYIDKKDYKNAIDALKKANKNIPDEANFYNILGVTLQREESASGITREKEVVSAYKEALRLNPYFIDVQINLGNYYISKGRLKEAITCFKEALKVQPWQEGWIETLKNLHLTLGKKGNAIADFCELLIINPDSYNIHKALAQLYYEDGNIEGFIKECKETIRVNPDDILMRRNLVAIYIQKKDYENAQKEAKDILAISPTDPETLRLLDLIKSNLSLPNKGNHLSSSLPSSR
ncbi:MAG: O-antigen ligase family protein [bacterium]